MQLPALDDRDTRGALWERRWCALGECILKATHFLIFCNTVLFYEDYDVYCTYSDELMFRRRIVQIN